MSIPPPENLVIEFPGSVGGCRARCRHCIHHNVVPSLDPDLAEQEIFDLLVQGRAMGIPNLNVYPHQDDICHLPPERIVPLFAYATSLGFRTKTVTNGSDPAVVDRVLPHLYRIAISVDALDPHTYGTLREPALHEAMVETLARVAKARARNPLLRVHALVMVNRQTLENIEERVARLVELDLFQKIKLLEMLPLGEAASLSDDTLSEQPQLDRLAALKTRYAGRVRIGTPLWRVDPGGRRGCKLGFKDMVIGPQGQLSGCTLLFYLNQQLGTVRELPLAEAWRTRFDHLRSKETRPVPASCRACALYERDLCWGGCLARRLVFGDAAEIARSCGVCGPDASRALYLNVRE
jgi:radical SAM protein with 4Fe4S-binding SPASM domain